MKTLFFIRNENQAKRAYQYYQQNKNKEIITLFPLSNEAHLYLQKKGVASKIIIDFILKKQKSRFLDCLKFNTRLANHSYWQKLKIGGKYPLLHLLHINLASWLTIILENYDYTISAIKFFNPDKIVAFEGFNLKSLSFEDIYFPFLTSNIKKIKPRAETKLLKEKLSKKEKKKDNYLFSLVRIITFNLMNNPLDLVRLIYYFIKARFAYLLTKNNQKTSGYNLLLFAYKHQLKNLIPLINKINKDKSFNLSLLTGGLRLPEMLALEKACIKYFDVDKFFNRSKEQKITSQYQEIIKFLENKKTELNLNKIFQEIGYPLLARPYYCFLVKTIKILLFPVLNSYYSIDKIFEELEPDLIINITDFKALSFLLVREAQLRHLPTLLLQHGGLGSKNPYDFISDYYAIWGKFTEIQALKILKKKKKQLQICGNFYLDNHRFSLLNPINNKPNFNNKRLVTVGCLITKYMAQFKQAIPYYELLRKISKLNLNSKKFQLILRTHPDQKLKGLKIYQSSLEEFIQKSDIIITEDTTAGIDAALYQKPLIYFNSCYNEYDFPFLEYKAALFARNPDDIIKQIKTIMTNPKIVEEMLSNQKKLINDCYYKLDNKSCERVISFIKKIMKTS